MLVEEWRYDMHWYAWGWFGSSPAIADLGSDVNNVGIEPDSDLEIITGSDEWWGPDPISAGVWRAFDSGGNLEWQRGTQTDEARSSPAIGDIDGDGDLEIVGGTTSGWYVQVMDHHGDFCWTFPKLPGYHVGGPFVWPSSPAVADLDHSISSGLEVVIGNRYHGNVWCFDGDNSDGVDEGITITAGDFSEFCPPLGTEGTDWDVLWIFQTGDSVVASPAVGDVDNDGKLEVVIGSTDGNVYVLNGVDGSREYTFPTEGSIYASAAIANLDNDKYLEIVIGSTDDKVYCFQWSGITGYTQWVFRTSDDVYSSAAIGDVDCDGEREIVVGSNDGKIYCLSSSGAEEWNYQTDGAIYSSPALAKASPSPFVGLDVYVGSDDGYLYLINGYSGSMIDRFQAHRSWFGGIHTSPSIADVDGDRHLEIFFYDWGDSSSYDGHTFWAIEDTLSKCEKYVVEWGMFRHDTFHSGTYGNEFGINGLSPIDIIVTDPDGLTISKEVNEIPGATYIEVDLNRDGDPDDQITIPYRKIGNYSITVIPEPDASPDDTYTLEITINGQTIVLAEDVLISDIPDQPYLIESTATEINAAPIADANGPYTGFIGLPITFDGRGSYDPDGTIVSYEWDLNDDGEFDDAFGATPTKNWDAPYFGNISLRVTDDDGATSVDTTTVTVMKTIKTVGEPKYGLNDKWVTSKTRFNLTVIPTSTYVNKTYYRIWYKGAWTPWMEYNGNFTLSGECKHYIEFYSVDNAGNVEEVHNQTHYVDDTPPETTIEFGTPYYTDGSEEWITSWTPITLIAGDRKPCPCGINKIYYRVYIKNETPGEFIEYDSPFTIQEECTHVIEYYSIDNLGNTEDIKKQLVKVDNTPPLSNITIGEPKFNWTEYLLTQIIHNIPPELVDTYMSLPLFVTNHTYFQLKARDQGKCPVGIEDIYYRIWNYFDAWAEWQKYEEKQDPIDVAKPGFTLKKQGPNHIQHYSQDLLQNKEKMVHNQTCLVDDTPPETQAFGYNPIILRTTEHGGKYIPKDPTETNIPKEFSPVGLFYIHYRYKIGENGEWSNWFTSDLQYFGGYVTITHNSILDPIYIDYYATDILGNKEETHHDVFEPQIHPFHLHLL